MTGVQTCALPIFEALISVNNELGLPDRATGVLHYVNQHYSHISIEPQWLQKLFHWEDARQSYLQQNMKWIESYPDDRPPKHPSWMAGEIGQGISLLFIRRKYEELHARSFYAL